MFEEVVLNGDSQNINRNTAGACAMYTDFTPDATLFADLTQGSSYTINVRQGTCNGDYNKSINVWIDFDGNGVFNNTDEQMLATGSALNNTTYTQAITINVPAGAVLGTTVMRVQVREGALASDPCAGFTWGENEDYNITIVSSGPMSYVSSTVTQTNNSNAQICNSDHELIGLEINMIGSTAPLNLSNIRLQTTGSTNPLADISNVDIYYTGTSNAFSTATLFGSSAPSANWSKLQCCRKSKPIRWNKLFLDRIRSQWSCNYREYN